MSTRPVPFAPNEWFHCYTRGVDKRDVFMDTKDYERYLMLLYTCNSDEPLHLSNLQSQPRQGLALRHVIGKRRGLPLVDMACYALMPNHLHLLLREVDYSGISTFMQKVGTAYTMYFNRKYERTGPLFSGKFRARHVSSDIYLRRLVNYIHANPAELYEPGWKSGRVKNLKELARELVTYPYSSLGDYANLDRPQRMIINTNALRELLPHEPSIRSVLEDARVLYGLEADELEP